MIQVKKKFITITETLRWPSEHPLPQSLLMCNMVNYLYSENRDISHLKLGTVIEKEKNPSCYCYKKLLK